VREPSDDTLRAALAETERVAVDVATVEDGHQLPTTPDLDAGLSPVLHHWVSGGALSSILAASWQEGVELTAGDFVRSARLVLDVLAQVGQVAGPDLARTARSAVGSLRRGVVLDHMSCLGRVGPPRPPRPAAGCRGPARSRRRVLPPAGCRPARAA